MKKVTPDSFQYSKGGSKKDTETQKLIENIDSLQEGEAILITKNEWKKKTKPNEYLRMYFMAGTISIRTVADNSGWVVIKKFNHPVFGCLKT